MNTASTALTRRTSSLADTVLAAVPLASIYIWLCIVYAIEAWKHSTPWLFTDELELTQISRSIAKTGHPSRRGQPYTFHSLYTIVTAPLWWFSNVATAYAGIKYLDVFLMTAVIFPTYFLARMLVPRGWALFAAAGAAVIPSLAYSSWIVEENLAYPYSALCFFLIAKALVTRRGGWIAVAAVASALAPAVRGELVVIPAGAVLAMIFAWWSTGWAKERRERWAKGDWVGTVVLVAGAIILVSGYLTWHNEYWLRVTPYNWTKYRAFAYGGWATGSLAIGLGVLPLVLGIASLFPARGEPRSRELRMFRSTAAALVITFGAYTFVKAGYLSMFFETRIEERNFIYISPLLFVGTALVLERRRVNRVALAVTALYGFYLIVGTPFQMNRQLYSDALGLAILQQANRYYEFTPTTAQWILIAVLVVGLALTLGCLFVRSRVVAVTLAAALAVGILAWNATGQISAAAGTVSISRDTEGQLGRPFSWVDETAHEQPTIYLAQGVATPVPEWLLEFWNRSIVTVSSLDDTLKGPGPSGAPNVTAGGQLYTSHDPANPGKVYAYGVEDVPCVDFAGTTVAKHFYTVGTVQKEWRLVQLTKPNYLRSECTGIYPDGWSTGDDSSYFRFRNDTAGWLRIRLSRNTWPATPVRVQIGTIGTEHFEPVLGHVTKTIHAEVESKGTRVLWIHTPATRFTAHVVIDNKFVPREVDPEGSSDPRTLGALIDYRFFKKRPSSAKLHTTG